MCGGKFNNRVVIFKKVSYRNQKIIKAIDIITLFIYNSFYKYIFNIFNIFN